jgi:hypothetical protein
MVGTQRTTNYSIESSAQNVRSIGTSRMNMSYTVSNAKQKCVVKHIDRDTLSKHGNADTSKRKN